MPDVTEDLLAKARRFASEWREQEIVPPNVFEELAAAVEAYDAQAVPVPPDLTGGILGALLEAVLAWRAQGALSRWTTPPSMHLARVADRLVRSYPELDEMRQRAGRGAIDNAMAHAEQLKTAAGRSREMAAIAAAMTDLVARAQALVMLDEGEPPEEADRDRSV